MEPTQAPVPVVVSAWDIAKLALSAGLVTAIANNFLVWLRDSRKDSKISSREATYSSIRISVILDEFAIKCAEIISDNDMYSRSGGHAGAPHGKLPSLAEYPGDIDWKSLDPTLTARVLSIPNELSLSEGTIKFWEDVDRETVSTACDDQAGKCGYRAWKLAEDIRRRYKLPAFDPKQTAWDVRGLLEVHHDTALKRVREAAAVE